MRDVPTERSHQLGRSRGRRAGVAPCARDSRGAPVATDGSVVKHTKPLATRGEPNHHREQVCGQVAEALWCGRDFLRGGLRSRPQRCCPSVAIVAIGDIGGVARRGDKDLVEDVHERRRVEYLFESHLALAPPGLSRQGCRSRPIEYLLLLL
jgi:hypothetical protein